METILFRGLKHRKTQKKSNHLNHDIVMTAITLKVLRTKQTDQQSQINQNPLQSSLANYNEGMV
jgi:hypothetical protein